MLYSETFKNLLKNEILQQVAGCEDVNEYFRIYARKSCIPSSTIPASIQEADVWIDSLLTQINCSENRELFCDSLNWLLRWMDSGQSYGFWSDVYDGINQGLDLTWFENTHLFELTLCEFDEHITTILWNQYWPSLSGKEHVDITPI